jgi:lincosamide nucleotidyltransferase A/C/D/E
MVSAEDAKDLYRLLADHGIQIWLTGGWGIDALLGKETRPHKDLDAVLLLDDMVRMREVLSTVGYELKDLWSENRWTIDGQGTRTATAFVLQDGEGHEFDAHAISLDDQGNGVPEWEEAEDFIFPKAGLAGEGLIAGFPVRCITPEMQVDCHTGYELPEKQVRDLELLQEKFGVEYPSRRNQTSA